MQWIRNQQPNPERVKAYKTAIFITLIGNLLLAVGKGVASYFTSSAALYADTPRVIHGLNL